MFTVLMLVWKFLPIMSGILDGIDQLDNLALIIAGLLARETISLRDWIMTR